MCFFFFLRNIFALVCFYFRQATQDAPEEVRNRDFRRELEERERAAAREKNRDRPTRGTNTTPHNCRIKLLAVVFLSFGNWNGLLFVWGFFGFNIGVSYNTLLNNMVRLEMIIRLIPSPSFYGSVLEGTR